MYGRLLGKTPREIFARKLTSGRLVTARPTRSAKLVEMVLGMITVRKIPINLVNYFSRVRFHYCQHLHGSSLKVLNPNCSNYHMEKRPLQGPQNHAILGSLAVHDLITL
jgi:hypothetical protein